MMNGNRTCTWSFPSLAAGQTGCVDLVVRVARDIPGGTDDHESRYD